VRRADSRKAIERLVRVHHAPLLLSAADLLRAGLCVWAASGRLLLAAREQPQARDLPGLRALVRRAARGGNVARRGATHSALCLAVPLRRQSGSGLVLTARWSRPSPIRVTASRRTFVEELAATLGRQLDLLQAADTASEELAGLHAERTLLHGVSGRLAQPQSARATLEFILSQGRDLADADAALLAMHSGSLLVVAPNEATGSGASLTSETLRQLSALLLERARGLLPERTAGPVRSLIAAALPLPATAQLAIAQILEDGHGQGFIGLLRADDRPFGRHELGLLRTLVEQTRLALHGGEMHQSLHDFLLSTVKALVSTIEAKDGYTSGHSTRVHLLSMLLGRAIGLSEAELETLKWASILHDVGKIGMPESILRKPGHLTDDEYEVMKRHPQRGCHVLSHVRQLREASQSVLLHHERYAGGGYPLGIAGTGIPRPARVIAVADTFDALTSRRPYRSPRSEDEAFREIRRVRGEQLDPEVVDALELMLPFLRENRVMLRETVEEEATEAAA
jgi:HD-GYP domain-containing protein (c-di-GMP phosphodiesterase class II)